MYEDITASHGTMNQVTTTWAVTKAIGNTKRNTESNEQIDVDYFCSLHISIHFWLYHTFIMGKITNRYWVVEGTHKDPNDIDTLDHETETEHGPYNNEQQASEIAKSLIQRNIDDYYHRAWVITKH